MRLWEVQREFRRLGIHDGDTAELIKLHHSEHRDDMVNNVK